MAVTLFGSFLRLGILTTVIAGLLSVYFDFAALSAYDNPILKDNMNEIEAIAKNKVKNAVSDEFVTFGSLWEKQPVVIVFFRRFGCAFCRVLAKQVSVIKPDLDANNVRLIGIGVEDLGKEDFIQGGYFDGELFIDQDMQSYKNLKYKRFGMISMLPAMFSKSSRAAMSEAWSKGVGGDIQGDVYQVGGVLVITTGGEKVLLNYRQQSLADHIDANDILRSLNIKPKEKISTPEMPKECKIDGDKSLCT